MSATLGDLIYMIRGNSSKLPADLKTSETQVKTFGQRISSGLKEQMNFAAGQVMAQGLSQLTTGLKSFVSDVVETSQTYTENISELSRETGSSLEESSRLYNMADDLKVEYGSLSTSLKLYAKTLKDSGSTEKLSTETLANLSAEYLKLPEGVARTNFALEKFGRSGTDMMKVLEVGPEKLREMAAGVSDFALVTEESKAANEAYYKSLHDWQDGLRDIKLAFAKDLLPYLTQFLAFLVSTVIPGLENLIQWFSALPEPVKGVIFAIGGLLTVLTSLLPVILSIGGLVNMIGGAEGIAAIGTAISTGLTTALGGLGAVVGAISLPVIALILAIGTLAVVVKEFGPQAWQTILTMGKIINVVCTDLANKVRSWFSEVGSNIVRGIGDGIQSGWQWLVTLVSNVAKSLLTGAKSVLGIKSPSKAFADQVGKQSALGIGKGFTENLHTVTDSMRNNLAQLPSNTMGGLGSGSVNVGHIEYHGSFSDDEMNRLDKRSRNIAGNTLMEAMG